MSTRNLTSNNYYTRDVNRSTSSRRNDMFTNLRRTFARRRNQTCTRRVHRLYPCGMCGEDRRNGMIDWWMHVDVWKIVNWRGVRVRWGIYGERNGSWNGVDWVGFRFSSGMITTREKKEHVTSIPPSNNGFPTKTVICDVHNRRLNE